MPDVVTMDKIVALCKRRGFLFQSSEIYGGLGSAVIFCITSKRCPFSQRYS